MIHTGYGKKTDRTGLNVSSLSLRLKKAAAMEFEKAAELRDRIKELEKLV